MSSPQPRLSLLQRLLIAIVPRSWAESMERESRKWIMTCQKCSARHSVWDTGGIRWNANGSPHTYIKCLTCGKYGMKQLVYEDK